MEDNTEINRCTIGLCHFCEHHGPCIIFHTRMTAIELSVKNQSRKKESLPVANNDTCTACNPFGVDHPGFRSLEQSLNKSTFSSNKCSTVNFKTQLQQTCFRSLSSEVSPTKEGPIFFSDSGLDIHVISYTFFLKDSSARGFQRWFSVVALGTESAQLLKLWSTIVSEMKTVIGELQQMAAEVYKREEEQCSHRMLRSNFNSAKVGATRSLQDITGNPAILLKLHIQFSRLVLLANQDSPQVNSLSVTSTPCIEDHVLALVKICEEIGPNFKIYARHIMKGGSTSISSDDLLFKENCMGALQYFVPIQTTKSFIIPQHTLQATSQPYLLISPKDRKITCILNNCDGKNKPSCIVSRLENILLAEDVSSSFIHKQITNIREQLIDAAQKMKELKEMEQSKVLQFFQSIGYGSGDLEVLHYWSLYC